MKTKTLRPTNSMNRLPVRRGFLLIPLALICFALSPSARAVCQEGCSGNNTFLGEDALISNTSVENTATGFEALFNNTTGSYNTATGNTALQSNSTGSNNTATGDQALLFNTTGDFNTANGSDALFSNTTGQENTANGLSTLFTNTEGNFNTASGAIALLDNTTGSNNTATGQAALIINTTGNNNTAIGQDALRNNTTGSSNIALGVEAGSHLTTGSSNIDIGSVGAVGESRTIRIGTKETHRHTAIAGISGATVAAGVGVIIDTNGHLGTVVSSERFKDAIKPMDKTSEAILALKPVTFRYKHELDPEGIPQFGLVAEEVEKVNPDLVARDADGKAYTVRYEAVNAMLLNEFIKEHRTVQELKKEMAALTATVKEQAAQIQKVNAHIELSGPAPRTVGNNQ